MKIPEQYYPGYDDNQGKFLSFTDERHIQHECGALRFMNAKEGKQRGKKAKRCSPATTDERLGQNWLRVLGRIREELAR